MSQQLKLIRTLTELQELEEYIKDKEYIAFDTETTGVDTNSEIIGFSVCANTEESYYVILSYWDKDKQELIRLPTYTKAATFLSNLVGKSLIMHNGVFDCMMVENNFKVSLISSLHTDTMILAHLLDENRRVGLKELGVSIFGETAKKEQEVMKASIQNNGGVCTKMSYELYKADADLIGYYGAKDAMLTLKLFYHLLPDLFEQKLDTFFYDEESMPLLRGPTYDLNTTGIRIDVNELQTLKQTLEAECLELKASIHNEIQELVKDEYPDFNIGSTNQLAWLLFIKLKKEFLTLTDVGKEVCQYLGIKIPYSPAAKREFIELCTARKDEVYQVGAKNTLTGKTSRDKKIRDPWVYMACGKEAIAKYSNYRWCSHLLKYMKNMKLLSTYVIGIQERISYGVLRSNFLQHGTTSGRYGSRNPNLQNLPRDDKRIKSCFVSRPGKVFVGADYSQLEPRVFASFSNDFPLLKCFKDKDDFYSVIGAPIYNKENISLKKDEEGSFASLYPKLRNVAKSVGLSATYGTTAFKMAHTIGCSIDEAQDVIDKYFENFPGVHAFMLERHETVKREGKVCNLFGRPRRIPEALELNDIYGKAKHADLPAAARNLLNLAVNHTIQSTAASIVNRAAIAFWKKSKELGLTAKIVLNVHDEIIVECLESESIQVVELLKECMEHTVELPGVDLIAEPKIAKKMSELK